MAGCTVRPLAGGSVARWVEQLTLHLSGGHAPLELVRKEAAALEIAGLSAAQAARADDTAIPELVAYGSDWLIPPFAAGVPLDWGDPVPANLFDTLAALHARYHGGAGLPAAIPRVTPAWWRALCLDWVDPGSVRTPPGTRRDHRASPGAHRPRRPRRPPRCWRACPDAAARRRPSGNVVRPRGRPRSSTGAAASARPRLTWPTS